MGKHKGSSSGAPQIVNDDLRQQIAESIVCGEDPNLIIERIASKGVTRALAVTEVERALKSPYLAAAERLRQRVTKRDWLLANYAKLACFDDHGEVTRVEMPTAADFFANYYHAHRPVIISGLVDHWRALGRWSLDEFETRLGNAVVRVQWARESDKDYERNADAHGTERPFSEVIARLRASESMPTNDFYVTANNHEHNRNALAPLYDDTGDIPGYLSEPGGRGGFIWIGPRGTITPWHHDLTNNLLMQIAGRKRVRLVSSLHAARMRNSRHCFSDWGSQRLEPGQGDESHPPVMIGDIGPGEAIFIPVGWWHHVEGLDVTLGMSFTNFVRDNDFWSHYSTFGNV